MSEARLFVRNPGWLTSASAAALLSATVLTVILTADSLTFFVTQAAVFALLLALIGLVVGSEIVVGLATAPALGSALIGVEDGSGLGWGRALIIGCLWYISMELAWSAIRQRTAPPWTSAIATQRAREVATVVVISLAIGLAATGLASLAPTRTLFLRAIIVGALLVMLTAAVRHLSTTAPPPEDV